MHSDTALKKLGKISIFASLFVATTLLAAKDYVVCSDHCYCVANEVKNTIEPRGNCWIQQQVNSQKENSGACTERGRANPGDCVCSDSRESTCVPKKENSNPRN